MHEKTRTHLARQLQLVCDNRTAEDAKGSIVTARFVNGPTKFTLIDDTYTKYLEVLIKLRGQSDWHDKFSDRFIQGKIDQLLLNVHSSGSSEQLGTEFTNLIESLDTFNERQYIYTPVGGMALNIPRLSIGNITFHRVDEEFLSTMRSRIVQAMSRSERPEDEKTAVLNEALSRLTLGGHGRVCAEFVVQAESGRAQERLLSELRDVFDVLRFVIAATHRHEEKVNVDVLGKILMTDVPSIALTGEDTNLFLQSVWLGPTNGLIISEENELVINSTGYKFFSDILRQGPHKRTQFEQVILRSLHWFANAHLQEESENRLLSLSVSLEVLLTPPGGQPIDASIAEAVALLIGHDTRQRKDIKRRVVELYGLRSGVVHGGAKAMSADDVNELELVVGMVLVHLAENRRRFATKAKLLEWLEEVKLGGGHPPDEAVS